jgi:hypothetical protein
MAAAISMIVLANLLLAGGLVAKIPNALTLFISVYIDLCSLIAFAAGTVLSALALRRGRLITESIRVLPVPLVTLCVGQLLPLFALAMNVLWLMTSGVWVVVMNQYQLVHWTILLESWVLTVASGWAGVVCYAIGTYLPRVFTRGSVSQTGRLVTQWAVILAAIAAAVALRNVRLSPGTITDWTTHGLGSSLLAILTMLILSVIGWVVSERTLRVDNPGPAATTWIKVRLQSRSLQGTITRWSFLGLLRDLDAFSYVYVFLLALGLGLWGIRYEVPEAYGFVSGAALYIAGFVTGSVALCAVGYDERIFWVLRTAPIRFGQYLAGKAWAHVGWGMALFGMLLVLDGGMGGFGTEQVLAGLSALSVCLLGFYLGSVEPITLEDHVRVTAASLCVVFLWGGINIVAHLSLPQALETWSVLAPVLVAATLLATRLRLTVWKHTSLWDEPSRDAEVERGA